MPYVQSRHLTDMKPRLRTMQDPADKRLAFRRYVKFCSLRDAEANIIPLGIGKG